MFLRMLNKVMSNTFVEDDAVQTNNIGDEKKNPLQKLLR